MKDEIGRYRTQSLFWETRTQIRPTKDNYDAIFTIKNYDHEVDGKVYYSLKNIYLSYDHIPGYEYQFALDVFGSWEHWQKIANDSIFKKNVADWREELEVRLKADAIRSLIKQSRINDAKAITAAKYLAEKGYVPTRGRPSKEEVEREKKIQAGVHKELQDDMARLGLSIINGSK